MTTNAAGVAPLERRVRRYPLDVEGGQSDEGAYCMSKGHHDKAAFLAEARIWWAPADEGPYQEIALTRFDPADNPDAPFADPGIAR